MLRAAALISVLLLAGCGGGGGGNGNGGNKAGGDVEDQLAYDMGFQQCTGFSVQDLASTYNTEPTAEAVAERVANTTPTQPQSRPSIKKGCLEALGQK